MTEMRISDLPICFTKKDLLSRFDIRLKALEARISRSLKNKTFFKLKNGLYILTDAYLREPNKVQLAEYITTQIYEPSYLSLEYILESHHVLSLRSARSLTSITTKSNRTFTNFAGSFVYSNIKPSCFFGFEDMKFHECTYRVATKAKALFDYFYLNSDLDYRNQKRLQHQLFKDLSIQWQNFSEEDFQQFDAYVWKSNSFKMMKVRRIIEKYFDKKKFNAWAKDLFS